VRLQRERKRGENNQGSSAFSNKAKLLVTPAVVCHYAAMAFKQKHASNFAYYALEKLRRSWDIQTGIASFWRETMEFVCWT